MLTPSKVLSYWVIVTKVRFKVSLLNPANSLSFIALVNSLALSGLKLKNTTESPFFIVAVGWPSSSITHGITNSSVFSSWYEFSIASTADDAFSPSPKTIAL